MKRLIYILLLNLPLSSFASENFVGGVIEACYKSDKVTLNVTTQPSTSYTDIRIQTRPTTSASWTTYAESSYDITDLDDPAFFRIMFYALDINDNEVNKSYSNALLIYKPNVGYIEDLEFNEVASGTIRLFNPAGTVDKWEKSTNGTTWTTVTTSDVLEVSIEGITQTTQFRVNIDQSCVIGGVNTQVGTVTIHSDNDIPTVSSSKYIIAPGESTSITLSLPGFGGTVSKWQKKVGVSWSDISSTSTSLAQTVTSPTFYRAYVLVNGDLVYTQAIYVDVISTLNYGDENHVKNARPITALTTEGSITNANSVTAISFYDGYGRNTQSIIKEASPGGNDIVSFKEYDEDGLQTKVYQGYTASPTSGTASHSNVQTAQAAFYNGSTTDVTANTRPYAEVSYADDLSARAESITGSGGAWATKSRDAEYEFNLATEEIRVWDSDGMSGDVYADGTLIKSKVTDEDGNDVIIYSDKQGKKICQRVEYETDEYLETYYVYDDYGRIRFIIPPEAMNNTVLEAEEGKVLIKEDEPIDTPTEDNYVILRGASLTLEDGFTFTASDGSTFHAFFGNGVIHLDDIERFVFEFQYDDEGRLIAKKVPGATGWEFFVYDKLNRLILSQNAKLREDNDWAFVKYDSRGRVAYGGLYNSADTRSQLQSSADSSTEYFEKENTSSTFQYYTANTFPSSNLIIHHVNYYDDYDRTTATYTNSHLTGQEAAKYDRTNHWLTSSKTKVLETSDWLETVYFYDDEGRVIQQQKSNHLDPTNLTDITTIIYDDFTGKVEKTKTTTEINGDDYVEQYRYEYDSRMLRLLKIHHKNGSDTEQEMVSYEYNELGQVVGKYVHKDGSEYIQETDFTYNEKGWLSMVNDPATTDDPKKLFSFKLHYNTSPSNLASDVAYNGRITGMEWSSYYTAKEAYGFQFDKANRMTLADYGSGSTNSTDANAYNEEVTSYDGNGNIQSLKRHQQGTLVDNLTYKYDGNQLYRVNESGNDELFENGEDSDTEMTYDDAGNLTADLNKGISSISYNHLDKPIQIDFEDGKQILYTYAANGAKLSRVHKDGGTVTERVDYVANYYVLDNDVAFFTTVEGRVVPTTAGQTEGGEYQYYHRDHLGNIRMVYTAEDPNLWTLEATMESENATTEETYFFNMSRTTNSTANTTPNGGTVTGDEVMMLDAQNRDGIGTVVEVFPGDEVTMTVNTYYASSGAVSAGAATLSDIAAAIFSTGTTSILGEGFTSSAVMPGGYPGGGALMTKSDNGNPEAYLNYLFFDRDFNYVSTFTGYAQVPGSGAQTISATTDEFTEPGYLFVYLTYEGDNDYPVSFDDLKIEHQTTRVLAYNSYYPFGLTTDRSWVRPENPYNRYLYNAGNERNALTGYDETFYRLYDPALGRFAGVDIAAVVDPSSGIFNYAGNNPLNYNDPMGDRKAPPPPRRIFGGRYFGWGHLAGFGLFNSGPSSITGNDPTARTGVYIQHSDGSTEFVGAFDAGLSNYEITQGIGPSWSSIPGDIRAETVKSVLADQGIKVIESAANIMAGHAGHTYVGTVLKNGAYIGTIDAEYFANGNIIGIGSVASDYQSGFSQSSGGSKESINAGGFFIGGLAGSFESGFDLGAKSLERISVVTGRSANGAYITESRKAVSLANKGAYLRATGATNALKIGGRIVGGGVVAYNGINLLANGGTDRDIAQFVTQSVITGVGFLGPIGFGVSIGLTAVEMAGGFDFIYESFDNSTVNKIGY